MTKKRRDAMVWDSPSLHGAGVYWDSKARFKHQSLMQDYLELQKETVSIKSTLEVSKQQKQMLTAEVRFLRRRCKLLLKTKTMNPSQKPSYVQPTNSRKRNKTMKEQNSYRKEFTLHRLPAIPELKPKKKDYARKEVTLSKPILHGYETIRSNLIPIFEMNHEGRTNIREETALRNAIPFLDLNPNASSRNSIGIFDLNQDSHRNGKEASLPSRALVFDLNEISTGDEEIQNINEPIMFEEAKKNFFNGTNDEQQHEIRMSVCRNAGEGSSHVGKRKISWLDPVALRV